jgi:polysaccharide chain length determinant protein (PEP-CTERM system associated)
MDQLLSQIFGYLHGMAHYRWSALLIAWLVAILGWIFVYAIPDQYQSNAVVHIDADSVMKPLMEGLAVEKMDPGAGQLKVLSRILLSPKNLSTLINETGLADEIETHGDQGRLIAALASTIVLKAVTPLDRRGGWTGSIYEIGYQSKSAQLSYKVVSHLLNTFIEQALLSTRTDTSAAQEFLGEQIVDYEQRLIIAEQRLADFKKANVGLMPNEKGGYYSRLQRSQEAIEDTRSALRLAERRRAELRKQLRGEKPLLDNSSYGAASAIKLRKYQEQLNSLLNQYTEQHPDVQALRATIEDLKANKTVIEDDAVAAGTGNSIEFNPVYQELKAEMGKVTVDVEALRIKLAEEEGRVERLTQSMDVIPEVEANLSKLNRDYEITREGYLELVKRRESARLSQEVGETAGVDAFRIIESPRVATLPSGPNRLLLLTLALLAGIGAGLGWSLLRHLLNPPFINLTEIKSKIGLPVLGSVSLYLSPKKKKQRRRQMVSFISAAVLLVGVYGGAILFKDSGVTLLKSVLDDATDTRL